MPPGAISSVLMARTRWSLKAQVLRRRLRQAVRVGDVLVHEQAAPAAPHRIEVFPVKRDARTYDSHVAGAVGRQGLAGTERDAVFRLEHHLLLEEEVLQFRVGRELETHRLDDLREELAQCLLPGFSAHLRLPQSPSSFA